MATFGYRQEIDGPPAHRSSPDVPSAGKAPKWTPAENKAILEAYEAYPGSPDLFRSYYNQNVDRQRTFGELYFQIQIASHASGVSIGADFMAALELAASGVFQLTASPSVPIERASETDTEGAKEKRQRGAAEVIRRIGKQGPARFYVRYKTGDGVRTTRAAPLGADPTSETSNLLAAEQFAVDVGKESADARARRALKAAASSAKPGVRTRDHGWRNELPSPKEIREWPWWWIRGKPYGKDLLRPCKMAVNWHGEVRTLLGPALDARTFKEHRFQFARCSPPPLED